ncbi:hypothetical protein BDV39DRAFT_205286 [Aspergillus sergii]|uniref:Prolyl 4-hydroxylase alpha subunit domain-containing protein n=1 Tax=Aspergillus sergii TaxID=1034303 RepID=A0A5N6X2L1_9EURO|nr:hypothetical protein BDV39DRAFT_205286 [Aspergillus sergii]
MAQIAESQAMIPLNSDIFGLLDVEYGVQEASFPHSPHVLSFTSATSALGSHHQTKPQLENLANSIDFIQPAIPPEGCPDHKPQVHLINQAPLMIYIEAFLTEEERLYLLSQSEPNYTPAYVFSEGDNGTTTDETVRKSETAGLQRDNVVQCIEYRARSLQANWGNMALEPLSVQRYRAGGFFKYHLDALPGDSLPNRKSTYNVWLDGNCTGGGTHFPAIQHGDDPTLCHWIDCNIAKANGTVFIPTAGNALFWEGMADDGSLYQETLHAGLPVEEGTKIGLNIWTWKFAAQDLRGGCQETYMSRN